MVKALVGLLLCLHLALARVSYEGYKVYHVTPKSEIEGKILHRLNGNSNYDFWSEPRILNVPATLMVSPNEQPKFEEKMKAYKMNVSVLIDNVERTIPKDDLKSSKVRLGEVSFTEYLRTEQINAYLLQLAVNYPQTVTLEELGSSSENRVLTAVRISSGGVQSKPAIFVDAGIHAREWIAPSTALYIIQELVENPIHRNLSRDIDWIVLPQVNPDGYNYSRTIDTLWRKTRSQTVSPICPGVDGNRNYDYEWMVAGADSQPCSDTFAGDQPFSEPETSAVKDFLQTHKAYIKLYLSLHSYGRYLLYPWGHTTTPPSNNEELYNLGIAVANSIRSYNSTNYIVGATANLLYLASGNSVDYAVGAAGVDLGYTVELPEGGLYGFHPPANMILPIVKETFEGIKEFQKYIQDKYVV